MTTTFGLRVKSAQLLLKQKLGKGFCQYYYVLYVKQFLVVIDHNITPTSAAACLSTVDTETNINLCPKIKMTKTEEQELSNQISRLSAKMRTYKKALTNPHLCTDSYKILVDNIIWIEAQIRELEAQLESHQLIAMMYNAVIPALLPS